MTPGEIITGEGDITLNADRRTLTLLVRNTADRPIQVGSHYHFAETNAALGFDRAQGFLWSEAMPLAGALEWLARQRARSAA